jgi:catechol 2,3-dioxygenase-like lactoylglutathione lyase family enzyme
MKNGIVGYRHAGVNVKDMDVSLAFYNGVLGLELISDRVSHDGGRFVGAGDTAVRICILGIPGSDAQIELLEYRNAGAARSTARPVDFSVAHASFWVEDIDALYERLVAADVRVLSPPIEPASGRKKFYACDPDGFLLELTEENP